MQKPTHFARRAVVGALAGAALVAAGCGDDGGDSSLDPASVLPANTPVYVEATVRPEGDLRSDFDAVASKVLRTDDAGARIRELVSSAIEDEDTTFEEDIEPWLGDKIGGGIVSLRNPTEPDFAIAIATTDPDAAFESLATEGTTEAEYEGVRYLRDEDDETVAGTIGDALVIGTEAGFKAVVDARDGESLAESDSFEAAREGVEVDEALGFAYADLEAAVTAVAAGQPLIASQIEPIREALGGAATIGAAFTVADGAIRVEAAQIGGKAVDQPGDPAAALAALPEGTVLGAGLGAVGDTLQKGLTQILSIGPVAGQDPQTLLRGLEAQFGLDLEKDLLSWMGEGAISVQGTSIQDIGGGLLVKSTDPRTTAATLEKLVPILEAAGAPVVDDAPEGASAGFRIGLGETGLQGLQILVGLQDDRFVIGVNPEVVESMLSGDQAGTLGQSAKFKAAASKLGGGIKPSFYLDLEALSGFLALAAAADPTLQQAVPYLDAFGAIVAGGARDGDTNRSRLAVTVKE